MVGKAAEGEAELGDYGTDALFLQRSMKNRISHCPSCQISHGFSRPGLRLPGYGHQFNPQPGPKKTSLGFLCPDPGLIGKGIGMFREICLGLLDCEGTSIVIIGTRSAYAGRTFRSTPSWICDEVT
jgi:hypothetical protein